MNYFITHLHTIQFLKIYQLVTSSCLSDIGPFFVSTHNAELPENFGTWFPNAYFSTTPNKRLDVRGAGLSPVVCISERQKLSTARLLNGFTLVGFRAAFSPSLPTACKGVPHEASEHEELLNDNADRRRFAILNVPSSAA